MSAFADKLILNPLVLKQLGERDFEDELGRLKEKGFELSMSGKAVEFLVRKGMHKALGARPMKRTVQKFIGDAIRDVLESGIIPYQEQFISNQLRERYL